MNRSVRHSFTIIELLVVIAIMGIVLTMTFAPFDKLVTAGGVDGAANMISGKLRACRQYAISQRARIALVIYRNEMTQAIRTAQLYKDDTFSNWTANSSWTFLPTGAVVEEVTDGGTLSFSAGQLEPIASGSGDPYPVIIYKPTGKLAGGNSPVIKISDALPNGSGGYTPRTAAGANWVKLTVNRFTGQVKVTQPGF